MTRQEIKDQLSAKLNTPAWDKAKNSLVGQELLSWGAEVIFAMQSQRYALEDIFNNVIADMSDIIRLSNSSIPTVQLTDPSFVVVDIDAILAGQNPATTFASKFSATQILPYALKLTSGSTQFYYTDYRHLITAAEHTADPSLVEGSVGQGVKCYQGIPQLYYYYPSDLAESSKLDFARTEPNIDNRTKINFLNQTWADDGHYSNYVNIGPNVLVSSIDVFIVDGGTVKLLHEADPMEMGEQDLSYKLYIDQNKNYNIVFGNGITGKFIAESTQFYITFLRLTDLDFSEKSLKLTFENQTSEQINLADYLSNVFSYRADEFQSVERAMADINKKVAARSALTTVSQIRAFLKSYPEIADAMIVAPETATPYKLPIYMVTQSGTLTNTAYIEAALRDRISLAYDVDLYVTPVTALIITSITAIEASVDTSELLPKIKEYLAEKYSHEAITYGQKVYRDSLLYEIKEKFGVELASISWANANGTAYNQVYYEQTKDNCYYIVNQ